MLAAMHATNRLDGALPLHEALKLSALPISRATAARWCRAGLVPSFRVGHRWYARPVDLQSALLVAVGAPVRP
ncbi:helix-turn-helix domain-containing protein [Methylibium sp.]|uniref:helix-turn-helix domain-containing protein n=1 Tax=Methylibium sp. TaxID=2067992 RepID=UPI0017A90ED2|nr:helix-turn-helix domain-containing protein [Methylibium sp.]MBA3590299.1 helix-turn-helix domain-containing protein [Methylibium sp.]